MCGWAGTSFAWDTMDFEPGIALLAPLGGAAGAAPWLAASRPHGWPPAGLMVGRWQAPWLATGRPHGWPPAGLVAGRWQAPWLAASRLHGWPTAGRPTDPACGAAPQVCQNTGHAKVIHRAIDGTQVDSVCCYLPPVLNEHIAHDL
eukprot:99536-Chlamydomonas_euryale.AAC.2